MTPLQQIEQDLDWREAELAVMKVLLANRNLGQREKTVLFRAGWALLYAHYEGFCKFSLTVYYDSIQGLGKMNRDLPQRMRAMALDRQIKDFRNLPTIDLITHIMDFENSYLLQPARFPDVDTESNLWPNTLKVLLNNAEIELQSLDRNNRSVATLVNRRNKIAHGERDIIHEYEYYLRFNDVVTDIMYDLAISIDEKLRTL